MGLQMGNWMYAEDLVRLLLKKERTANRRTKFGFLPQLRIEPMIKPFPEKGVVQLRLKQSIDPSLNR
jgi:hypothetical protein